MQSLKFVVAGRVQGVFFRKHTHLQAQALELVGYVRNATNGTVVGVAQGPGSKIDAFHTWLTTTGSPKSRVDNVTTVRTSVERTTFDSFTVDRSYFEASDEPCGGFLSPDEFSHASVVHNAH
ncbi:MAG: hypothetical protein MHM6MM_006194 [Cercozoa sp. M6MM]